jgi:intracellular protein transport protein USO1
MCNYTFKNTNNIKISKVFNYKKMDKLINYDKKDFFENQNISNISNGTSIKINELEETINEIIQDVNETTSKLHKNILKVNERVNSLTTINENNLEKIADNLKDRMTVVVYEKENPDTVINFDKLKTSVNTEIKNMSSNLNKLSDEVKNRYDKYNEQLLNVNSIITSIDLKINTDSSKYGDMEKKLESNIKNLDVVNKKTESVKSVLLLWDQYKNVTDENVSKLNNSISSMHENNSLFKKSLTETIKSELTETKNSFNNKLSSLKTTTDEINNLVSTTNEKTEKVDKKLKDLDQNISKLIISNDVSTENISKIEEQLSSDLNNLIKKIETTKKECDSYVDTKFSKLTEISLTHTELSSYVEKKLKELPRNELTYDKINDIVNDIMNDKITKLKNTDVLEKELKSYVDDKLSKLKDNTSSVDSKIDSKIDTVNAKIENLSKLYITKKDLDNSKSKVQDLKSIKDELTSYIDSKSKVPDLKSIKDELTSYIDSKNKVPNLKSIKDELTSELSSVITNKIEDSKKSFDNIISEKLKKEIDEKISESCELNIFKTELNVEMEKLRNYVEINDKKQNDLLKLSESSLKNNSPVIGQSSNEKQNHNFNNNIHTNVSNKYVFSGETTGGRITIYPGYNNLTDKNDPSITSISSSKGNILFPQKVLFSELTAYTKMKTEILEAATIKAKKIISDSISTSKLDDVKTINGIDIKNFLQDNKTISLNVESDNEYQISEDKNVNYVKVFVDGWEIPISNKTWTWKKTETGISIKTFIFDDEDEKFNYQIKIY